MDVVSMPVLDFQFHLSMICFYWQCLKNNSSVLSWAWDHDRSCKSLWASSFGSYIRHYCSLHLGRQSLSQLPLFPLEIPLAPSSFSYFSQTYAKGLVQLTSFVDLVRIIKHQLVTFHDHYNAKGFMQWNPFLYNVLMNGLFMCAYKAMYTVHFRKRL